MNNDLISRSELKKSLKSNCKPELCHDYNTAWCESCCPHNDFEDLIDNAPSVEQKEFEQVLQPIKVNIPEDIKDKLIEELSKPRKVIFDEPETVQDCIIAYGDGFESARRLFERPHGEWIKSKEWMKGTITTIYKCSECGRTIATMPNRLDEYPFCHCGADMRKGGDNE